jgi:hydroxyethylthiazole kinase-like uncharacterized protein yjeF
MGYGTSLSSTTTMPDSAINQTLFFSREALRAIDADATKIFNLHSLILMENAARGAARIILESTDAELRGNILILCGCGNNGGDGYGVARHLVNAGCNVTLLQCGEPRSEDARINASICSAMEIPQFQWSEFDYKNATLFIDALFGTGLDRTVTGIFENAIDATNTHAAPCVSLDIPSGMECDTGVLLGCCIQASMTISFVGMKLGFQNESTESALGEVVITDIGCPQSLLQTYGSVVN